MPGVNPFVGLFVAAAALMVALFVPVFSLPIDRGERMAEAPDGDGADGRPAAGRTAPRLRGRRTYRSLSAHRRDSWARACAGSATFPSSRRSAVDGRGGGG